MLGQTEVPASAAVALAGVVERAQVAEWLMAADCKSAGPRIYGGSNPPLCTRFLNEVLDSDGCVRGAGGFGGHHHRRP